MEVIVFTSPGKNENEVENIIQLFDSGLETLHVRKPKWATDDLDDFIAQIPNQFHNRIIIHGHYSLARKYKLKGIHLRRKHRSDKLKNRWKRFLLRLKNPGILITTTFNSLESLRDNSQRFDYVFLSSVFNSHSYYSQDEEAGINMLKSIVRGSTNKIYAVGGVTPERIPLVQAAGFAGVGLSSAVWKHIDNDPDRVMALFRAA